MNLAKSWNWVNTQKSLAFLYTNNKRSEREIRETISLTITLKRMKHLGINLPSEAKDKVRKLSGKKSKIYHILGLQESIL